MLNVFLTSLVTYGLNSNIVVNSGVGTLLFGREKKYRFFRYINALFLVLGIIICSVIIYFLNKFVFMAYDLSEIKVGVAVIVASLYNLLVSFFWKKISLFGHYLHEGSCSYVFDMIFAVYVAMTLDLTLEVVPFLLSVGAVVVVVLVMTVFIGFYVDSINKSTLNVCFRNVSARLYLMMIFALILFYANMLI